MLRVFIGMLGGSTNCCMEGDNREGVHSSPDAKGANCYRCFILGVPMSLGKTEGIGIFGVWTSALSELGEVTPIVFLTKGKENSSKMTF